MTHPQMNQLPTPEEVKKSISRIKEYAIKVEDNCSPNPTAYTRAIRDDVGTLELLIMNLTLDREQVRQKVLEELQDYFKKHGAGYVFETNDIVNRLRSLADQSTEPKEKEA